MMPAALKRAEARFRIAHKALERMKDAKTFEDLEDDWFVFLRAWKAIYTMLQEGANGFPRSEMWFGQQNAFRRKDQLLQYLYQARNDDEHGLVDTTKRRAPSASWGHRIGAGPVHITNLHIRGNGGGLPTITYGTATGVDPSWRFIPGKVFLVPVKDRNAKVYNPPRKHLGIDYVNGLNPTAVAESGLRYTAHLLEEVRAL